MAASESVRPCRPRPLELPVQCPPMSAAPNTARKTRNTASLASDIASLTAREKLIFAQAVYEFGAGGKVWTEISRLLTKHPLLVERGEKFFTSQARILSFSYVYILMYLTTSLVQSYIMSLWANQGLNGACNNPAAASHNLAHTEFHLFEAQRLMTVLEVSRLRHLMTLFNTIACSSWAPETCSKTLCYARSRAEGSDCRWGKKIQVRDI